MESMDTLDWVSKFLATVGAVNWGLVGSGRFNLVEELFGHDTATSRFVYLLVGLAGLWSLYRMFERASATNTSTSNPITQLFGR